MEFDPYYSWLGIPPSQRPPTCYRLVGVPDFEANLDKIHRFALQQIAKLRRHQSGKHGDLTQTLMNEISQARLLLLDPTRKAEYDNQLRLSQQVETFASESSPAPRSTLATALAPMLAVLALIAAAVAAFVVFNRPSPKIDTDDQAQTPVVGTDEQAPPNTDKTEPTAKAIVAKSVSPEKKAQIGKPTRKPATSVAKLKSATTKAEAIAKTKAAPDPLDNQKPVGWTVRRQDDEPPAALDLQPGVAVNLDFLNTPDDETNPSLEGDGKRLHFSRQSAKSKKLYFGIRDSLAEQFPIVASLNGLPKSGDQVSAAVSADQRSVIFASDHAGDQFDLFEAKRADALAPLGSPMLLDGVCSDADELDPFLTHDGKELYFARREKSNFQLYRARRVSPADPFGPPEKLPFERGYHHASLTEDGLVMYLQGPLRGIRSGIFQCTRANRNSSWSRPALAFSAGVNDAGGDIGAVAPCISPKGDLLYFASDRVGGYGGLDLWVVRPGVPADPDEKRQPIREWLTAGPIPRESLEVDDPLGALKALVPIRMLKLPQKEGESIPKTGLNWRRVDSFENTPGAHLVFAMFEIKRPTTAQVVVHSAPGGAIFWVNQDPALEAGGNTPWSQPILLSQTGAPIKLMKGKHRLLGVVCVAAPSTPLHVELHEVATKAHIEPMPFGGK